MEFSEIGELIGKNNEKFGNCFEGMDNITVCVLHAHEQLRKCLNSKHMRELSYKRKAARCQVKISAIFDSKTLGKQTITEIIQTKSSNVGHNVQKALFEEFLDYEIKAAIVSVFINPGNHDQKPYESWLFLNGCN